MTLTLKLFFITFYILLTIFLIYEEYSISKDNYLRSGPLYNRFKEILTLTTGLGGLYQLYNSGKFEKEVKDREELALKTLRELQEDQKALLADKADKDREIRNLKASGEEKDFQIKILENNSNKLAQDLKHNAQEQKKCEDLAKYFGDNYKIANNPNLSPEERQRQSEQLSQNFLKDHPDLVKNQPGSGNGSNIGGNSSNFIDFKNFNFQEFLSSLSRLELFAFITLCFNALILNAIISIVFIFYGDILIKYFNLEVRFPKLAKFISFRRKLNNYALKYNLFLILLSIGSQMFASLLIF